MVNPMRILFVCLGNICRSPLAEVIAKETAKKLQVDQSFHFESAGTGNWHIGGQADPRSSAVALKYGLDLSQHCAQQISTQTVQRWDYLIAMDHDNRLNLLAMGAESHKVLMMRQFEEHHSHLQDIQNVPDPYYGGDHGFEDVYAMLSMNAEHLLKHVLQGGNSIHSK